MENNESVVTTTETVEESVEMSPDISEKKDKKETKTYTRDEVNKMISAEKERIREDLKLEVERQKTEAEKLAQMDDEAKRNYELENERKRREEVEAKLNAYELKEEAIKQAKERDLDISLLDVIDYAKETADSVKEKINVIDRTFKSTIDKRISEKLNENKPFDMPFDGTKSDHDQAMKNYERYL